jgi:hypothetical protein
MTIDWYVKANEGIYAPQGLVSEKFMKQVIKTATPCMDYFCKRLSEVEDLDIFKIEGVFGEIVEEMPVMNYRISEIDGVNEFIIKYNKWVDIRLTDTTKQIYREIKLTKILS